MKRIFIKVLGFFVYYIKIFICLCKYFVDNYYFYLGLDGKGYFYFR